MELLDWFIARFSVDANRIYVGGISLGSIPTAGGLGSRPGFFAAALMLAGVAGGPIITPSAMKHVPLWVTCGPDDSPFD